MDAASPFDEERIRSLQTPATCRVAARLWIAELIANCPNARETSASRRSPAPVRTI